MSHGFSKMLSYIIFSTMFASVFGHMQLQTPYPLRSPLNPNQSGQIDYDMTAPLAADGSNFPCKGYHKDTGVTPVQTYVAGQTYNVQIAGSASHGGGSCQLVLSHDNGATWGVVKSIIGGCPLKSTYSFKMPSNVKNGEGVLFGWTWNNRVGNREFYMNCARVTITGGSGSWNPPAMFTANIGGSCAVPEGLDVVYPNPGDQVEYGGSYSSSSPPAPSQLDGCVQGTTPPPTEEQPNEEQPAPTTEVPTTEDPTTVETTYPDPTEPAPEPTEPAPEPTEPAPTTIDSQPTTAPVCNDQTTTIVQTVTQTHTQVQYVTVTRGSEDKITRTHRPTTTKDTSKETSTAESCDQSQLEEIKCYANGKKWKFCDGTEWVDMGGCAEGQICQDGKLVDIPY